MNFKEGDFYTLRKRGCTHIVQYLGAKRGYRRNVHKGKHVYDSYYEFKIIMLDGRYPNYHLGQILQFNDKELWSSKIVIEHYI